VQPERRNATFWSAAPESVFQFLPERFKGIPCALCRQYFTAKVTRKHNDANVVAFTARMFEIEVALDIARVFLLPDFEPERQANRIATAGDFENSQQ
jgi:ribose 5-phosphate isomerase B